MKLKSPPQLLSIIFAFIFLGFGLNLKAQAPNLFNYQGVARNAQGIPLPNQTMHLRISVRSYSAIGPVVYSEIRSIQTNAWGLFSVQVGSDGTMATTGTIAGVNWLQGNKYLEVEIDPNAGFNFINLGVTQLLSVPYAFNAVTAGSAVPSGSAGGDLAGVYPNPSIANNAITTIKLADFSVSSFKLSDQAVTTNKLADGSVTDAKIANGISASKVGLGNVDNTSDLNKPISKAVQTALDGKLSSGDISMKANQTDVNTALALKANAADVNTGLALKVDKVSGKGLSANDYTTAEKNKLAAITGTNTGDQDLSLYATTTALALKANTTDVNTALALKANVTDVNTALALKANAADVTTSLASKAPLASPALTGTPLAPTATAGTNTTQIATTAYVQTAVQSTDLGTPTSVILTNATGLPLSTGVTGVLPVANGGTGANSVNGILTTLGFLSNNIAIGNTAGSPGLDVNANTIAIGGGAGRTGQGQSSVSIGVVAGNTNQGSNSVGIGGNAAQNDQGTQAVALGFAAGQNSQGAYSVAIGAFAGNSQVANSIAINATGNNLNPTNAGFYVDPVRNLVQSSSLYFDATTKEITYGVVPGSGGGTLVREIADEFTATASQSGFTLTQTPSANSKVKMFVNGIRISNTAYSITGTTLTYIPANNGSYALALGDRIQFDFYY